MIESIACPNVSNQPHAKSSHSRPHTECPNNLIIRPLPPEVNSRNHVLDQMH